MVKTLTLGAVLTPAIANQFREMMRALPRISVERFDQALRHGPRTIDITLLQFGN